jgi:hypothetical protein
MWLDCDADDIEINKGAEQADGGKCTEGVSSLKHMKMYFAYFST